MFYCNECFAMVKPVKKKKPVVRCAALDCDGKQCRKNGVLTVEYFGEGEIYRHFEQNSVTWVKIKVCREHFDGINN